MNRQLLPLFLVLALACGCWAQTFNQVVQQDGFGDFSLKIQSDSQVWAAPSIQIFIDDTVTDRDARREAQSALSQFPWLARQVVDATAQTPPPSDSTWRPAQATTEMSGLFERIIPGRFAATTEMQPITLQTPAAGRQWTATPDIWRPPFLTDESLALKAWRARLAFRNEDHLFCPSASAYIALLVQAPDSNEFSLAYDKLGTWSAYDILRLEVQSFGVFDSALNSLPFPEDDTDAAGEGLPSLPTDLPVVLTSSGHVMTLTLRSSATVNDSDFFGLSLVSTAVAGGTLRIPMSHMFPPLSAEIVVNGQVVTLTGGIPDGPKFAEFPMPNGVVAGDQITLVAIENYHSKTVLSTPFPIQVGTSHSAP